MFEFGSTWEKKLPLFSCLGECQNNSSLTTNANVLTSIKVNSLNREVGICAVALSLYSGFRSLNALCLFKPHW